MRLQRPRAPDPLRDHHEPRFGPELLRHYLGELVYGANDGIITTFAVVSGVAGAALSPATALILGLANLFADGFSMGASAYLAIRSREAVRAQGGLEVEEPFPPRHALATGVAFVIAGAVPLAAFAVAPVEARFAVASAVTLLTLFVVGALRALVTPMRWFRAGIEMLAVGSVAAVVAYGVGRAVKDLLVGG